MKLIDIFIEKVGKFVNKALVKSNQSELNLSLLNEKQFRGFLDADGRVKCDRELRISVFRRGIEHGLRKVIWKHLLNIYPTGLTGQQRIDYMKLKSETYFQLKNLWQANTTDPEVENIVNMVINS